MTDLDTALWIDGQAAVTTALLARDREDWPPLYRLVPGGKREANLWEARLDLEQGWDVRCYMYPVPRAKLEDELAACEADPSDDPERRVWVERVRAALRGDDKAIAVVAQALLRAEVAS